MFNIVIFGAPGSGKGTQSENLIAKYGLFHISTGDVLRDHIKRGTELGKIADGYIKQGQLIPDELMVSILAQVLDSNAEAKKGVIFDGFPRTIPQAKALKTMLAERGAVVNAVLALKLTMPNLSTALSSVARNRAAATTILRQSRSASTFITTRLHHCATSTLAKAVTKPLKALVQSTRFSAV